MSISTAGVVHHGVVKAGLCQVATSILLEMQLMKLGLETTNLPARDSHDLPGSPGLPHSPTISALLRLIPKQGPLTLGTELTPLQTSIQYLSLLEEIVAESLALR